MDQNKSIKEMKIKELNWRYTKIPIGFSDEPNHQWTAEIGDSEHFSVLNRATGIPFVRDTETAYVNREGKRTTAIVSSYDVRDHPEKTVAECIEHIQNNRTM